MSQYIAVNGDQKVTHVGHVGETIDDLWDKVVEDGYADDPDGYLDNQDGSKTWYMALREGEWVEDHDEDIQPYAAIDTMQCRVCKAPIGLVLAESEYDRGPVERPKFIEYYQDTDSNKSRYCEDCALARRVG